MPCRKVSILLRLIRHLIADTPDYNARVVPVPQKHGAQILLMAGFKPLGIAPALMGVAACLLVFENPPLIKGLIHHQKSHLIAQIQKGNVRRVVGHTDCVYSHFLKLFKAPLPNLGWHRSSHTAAVMMETDAVYLALPAI